MDDPDLDGPLSQRVHGYLRARVVREIEEGHLDGNEVDEAETALRLGDDPKVSIREGIEVMLDFLVQFEEC